MASKSVVPPMFIRSHLAIFSAVQSPHLQEPGDRSASRSFRAQSSTSAALLQHTQSPASSTPAVSPSGVHSSFFSCVQSPHSQTPPSPPGPAGDISPATRLCRSRHHPSSTSGSQHLHSPVSGSMYGTSPLDRTGFPSTLEIITSDTPLRRPSKKHSSSFLSVHGPHSHFSTSAVRSSSLQWSIRTAFQQSPHTQYPSASTSARRWCSLAQY